MLQGLPGCPDTGSQSQGRAGQTRERRGTGTQREAHPCKSSSQGCRRAVLLGGRPLGPGNHRPAQPSTRCEEAPEEPAALPSPPGSCLGEACLDSLLFVLIGIKTTPSTFMLLQKLLRPAASVIWGLGRNTEPPAPPWIHESPSVI